MNKLGGVFVEKILNGRALADKLQDKLKQEVSEWENKEKDYQN